MQLHFCLLLFALLNVVAAPGFVASSSLHRQGSSVDNLSCVIQEPCRRCDAKDIEDAHCKTTGQYMLLRCSLEGDQSSSQQQVKLPWPLPHDATQLGQEGPQMAVEYSCRMKDPSIPALLKVSSSANAVSHGASQGHTSLLLQAPVDADLHEGEQPGTLVHAAAPAKVHLPRIYSRKMQTNTVDAQEDNSTHIEIKEVELTLAPLHMSLFNFELIMLSMLGVTLPVVYWRKIRVHYL